MPKPFSGERLRKKSICGVALRALMLNVPPVRLAPRPLRAWHLEFFPEPESFSNLKLDEGKCMRIGHGYDVHRLVEGRKLILGGVDIPYAKGLLGHSDADVLLHAISDAILGAIAEGDIGRHFPDTDPRYKGADSQKLLSHVMKLADDKGYRVGNLDATIVAQRPKLATHIPRMRENIAVVLFAEIDRVNVKATTTEELGFAGRGEGIAAYAVVLMERK